MINIILMYLMLLFLLILFFKGRAENEDIEECKKIIKQSKLY